jgi:hypothetical protein
MGTLIGDSPDVKARIEYFQRKLSRENRALRFLQLHPDRFRAAPPRRHVKQDRYILTTAVATEAVRKSSIWAGDETAVAWTGSSGGEQVLGAVGTITVPTVSIPTTSGGNGLCDGKGACYFMASWWIWIGGDGRINTYWNGTGNAPFQAGAIASLACNKGSTLAGTTTYQVFEEIPSQETSVVLGAVSAASVITINLTVGRDPNTGDPMMNWVMSGDFSNSGYDIDAVAGDKLPANTAEVISERNFPDAIPKPGTPSYAYPIPYSLGGSVFSATTYTSTWYVNGRSNDTRSNLSINVSCGTEVNCSENSNLCMRPYLSSTNGNPCDALAGAINGDVGGGANYVYENPPKPGQNYFCLTHYID